MRFHISSILSLIVLNEAKAESTRDNHSCYQEEPCSIESSYYNWLACDCFATLQCAIACADPGFTLQPNEVCGECVSEDWIRALYPS